MSNYPLTRQPIPPRRPRGQSVPGPDRRERTPGRVMPRPNAGEPPRTGRRPRAVAPWSRAGAEPSLDEVLADPIVRLVMDSDRLTTEDVRAAVRRAVVMH